MAALSSLDARIARGLLRRNGARHWLASSRSDKNAILSGSLLAPSPSRHNYLDRRTGPHIGLLHDQLADPPAPARHPFGPAFPKVWDALRERFGMYLDQKENSPLSPSRSREQLYLPRPERGGDPDNPWSIEPQDGVFQTIRVY